MSFSSSSRCSSAFSANPETSKSSANPIQTKQLSFYPHSFTTIHCQYIQNFIQILSTEQQSFNKQLQIQLYEPLVNITKEFNRMNNEENGESLKSFLFTFKIHIDRFYEIIHDLYQQITDGSKTIDQLFIQIKEQIWNDIKKQQKQLLNEISLIKQENISTDKKSFNDIFYLLRISDIEQNNSSEIK
ncbi:unnamed protein product [Adineta steineri]|uniref:Uncharacterized protein n=1 Tax=Adineta steineri TaxID=433720 RepID=A0A819UTD4_9BILA|nr:unnamed protein product [Adineta steineri]CAF4100237.1 unnamed protein product [Adineta steineri]